MKKLLKTLFHLKTPIFKGVERCIYCGGRAQGCCPTKPARD